MAKNVAITTNFHTFYFIEMKLTNYVNKFTTQAHTPTVLFSTTVRPVALIATRRSCEPTLGVALHTVKSACVVPTPIG
jgi:hypothetical protein